MRSCSSQNTNIFKMYCTYALHQMAKRKSNNQIFFAKVHVEHLQRRSGLCSQGERNLMLFDTKKCKRADNGNR